MRSGINRSLRSCFVVYLGSVINFLICLGFRLWDKSLEIFELKVLWVSSLKKFLKVLFLPLVGLLVGSTYKYTIVIDAGSTGSRIHIFKFNCSQNGVDLNLITPENISDTIYYTRSSISAVFLQWYPREGILAATRAAMSINPLIEKAISIIPPKERMKTPLILKATAGLRYLDVEVPGITSVILNELRNNFSAYNFNTTNNDTNLPTVSVMSGREEGIYAWLALNWSLGRLYYKTVAIVDLGGASGQLVFEVPKNLSIAYKRQYIAKLAIGPHEYHLSYRSNELYGLISARKNLLLSFEISDENSYRHTEGNIKTLHAHCYKSNACYPISDFVTGDTHTICGLSDTFDDCHNSIRNVMFNKSACSKLDKTSKNKVNKDLLSSNELKLYRATYRARCDFVGIGGTQDLIILRSTVIYATSFYFDNFAKVHIQPSGSIIGSSLVNITSINADKDTFAYKFDLYTLRDIATRVCSTHSHLESPIPNTILYEKMINQCFDLTYMYNLLKNGYGISEDHEITGVKLINGLEIGWPLGMALYSLTSAKIVYDVTNHSTIVA